MVAGAARDCVRRGGTSAYARTRARTHKRTWAQDVAHTHTRERARNIHSSRAARELGAAKLMTTKADSACKLITVPLARARAPLARYLVTLGR